MIRSGGQYTSRVRSERTIANKRTKNREVRSLPVRERGDNS